MKLNTLIPMTDFVNKIGNMENYPGHEKALSWIYNYANFLKQPLKLEMFVPCDEDGNVLKEPKNMADAILDGDSGKDWANKSVKYEEAKEKVLFEGFRVEKMDNFFLVICEKTQVSVFASTDKTKDIEFLLKYGIEIELAPTAIKQIQP